MKSNFIIKLLENRIIQLIGFLIFLSLFVYFFWIPPFQFLYPFINKDLFQWSFFALSMICLWKKLESPKNFNIPGSIQISFTTVFNEKSLDNSDLKDRLYLDYYLIKKITPIDQLIIERFFRKSKIRKINIIEERYEEFKKINLPPEKLEKYALSILSKIISEISNKQSYETSLKERISLISDIRRAEDLEGFQELINQFFNILRDFWNDIKKSNNYIYKNFPSFDPTKQLADNCSQIKDIGALKNEAATLNHKIEDLIQSLPKKDEGTIFKTLFNVITLKIQNEPWKEKWKNIDWREKRRLENYITYRSRIYEDAKKQLINENLISENLDELDIEDLDNSLIDYIDKRIRYLKTIDFSIDADIEFFKDSQKTPGHSILKRAIRRELIQDFGFKEEEIVEVESKDQDLVFTPNIDLLSIKDSEKPQWFDIRIKKLERIESEINKISTIVHHYNIEWAIIDINRSIWFKFLEQFKAKYIIPPIMKLYDQIRRKKQNEGFKEIICELLRRNIAIKHIIFDPSTDFDLEKKFNYLTPAIKVSWK